MAMMAPALVDHEELRSVEDDEYAIDYLSDATIYYTQLSDVVRSAHVETIPRHERTHLTELIDALRREIRRPANWDGFGAAEVNRVVAVRALQFMTSEGLLDVPTPSVAATPDGGLLFEWCRSNHEVELYFDPNGSTQTVIHIDDEEVLDSTFPETSPDGSAIERLSEVLHQLA